MTPEIRQATSSDLEEIVAVDARNFAYEPEPGSLELFTRLLDMDRFLVATDGGRIVGIAGTFDKTITLPGRATVPMAGVTWVSVSTTHRRRGILSGLMAGLDEQATTRGEPLLGLMASESSIYERFGYGVATRARSIEIDRRMAQLRPEFRPAPGSVELIEPRDRVTDLVEVFDRYQRTNVGAVSRDELSFREMHFSGKKNVYGALHADGFAIWRIESSWSHGQPEGRLIIDDLIAATPDAHLALWHTLLSIDLVGPISGWNAAALDDPLVYAIEDHRSIHTTDLQDHLWLKVLDPVTAFGRRTLRTDDELVIRIEPTPLVGATRPDADPGAVDLLVGSGRAEPTDRAPDLVVTGNGAGPLLLGGVTASTLAAGRRLRADPEVLARADAAFSISPLPRCTTPF